MVSVVQGLNDYFCVKIKLGDSETFNVTEYIILFYWYIIIMFIEKNNLSFISVLF